MKPRSNQFYIAESHPNHFLNFSRRMFSGYFPSPRVGEPILNNGGRGSIARKCRPAQTEKSNPKNDLGVT